MDRAPRASVGALWVLPVAIALIGGLLASCSTTTVADRTGRLLWHRCGGIECTTLSVPLDWSHPTRGRIRLSLARRPANSRRRGVLLTNPGGPGGSGIQLVQQADGVFRAAVLDQFDIVSWDPRGVDASAPARCADHLDFFYTIDRNRTGAAAARANAEVAQRFVAECKRQGGRLLPYLSTRTTVRDMDAIRDAMGVPTVDYLGFSYGSYIGALYANRYPSRVRAMVLDGAVDPAASYEASTVEQAVGFEHALTSFLAWCRDDRRCAFARNGNPVTSFTDLMESLTDETDPAIVQGEHRTLGIGEANIGVASALYAGKGDDGWIALGAALNDAARTDGGALLALSDSYTGRQPGGTYDNLTAAFYSISCLDGPAPRTIAAVERLAARAARVAPNFGASTAWLGLPCTFWPAPPDGRPETIHAAGAPPIVVIGNTGDPATPYAQAESLARELQSGRLLTYVGEGHTAYGRGSDCIDNAVDRYLIALELPAPGTRCK